MVWPSLSYQATVQCIFLSTRYNILARSGAFYFQSTGNLLNQLVSSTGPTRRLKSPHWIRSKVDVFNINTNITLKWKREGEAWNDKSWPYSGVESIFWKKINCPGWLGLTGKLWTLSLERFSFTKVYVSLNSTTTTCPGTQTFSWRSEIRILSRLSKVCFRKSNLTTLSKENWREAISRQVSWESRPESTRALTKVGRPGGTVWLYSLYHEKLVWCFFFFN